MASGAFAPTESGTDQPQHQQHDGGDPKEMERKARSSQNQDYEKCK
jgi:hypothetical protein